MSRRARVVNLFFVPSTQGKATSKLADELLKRLAAAEREQAASAQ